MSEFNIVGMEGFETYAIDNNTIGVRPKWISVKDRLPPKNERFLAMSYGIEIMEWKERIVDGSNKGWFGLYCGCACCNGYCTSKFDFWMPLPLPPKDVE